MGRLKIVQGRLEFKESLCVESRQRLCKVPL